MKRENRSIAKLSLMVMLMLLLGICITTQGCTGTRTVYLRGDEEVVHLDKGEPSPHEGFLLTPNKMADVLDRLGDMMD